MLLQPFLLRFRLFFAQNTEGVTSASSPYLKHISPPLALA
jgi:hypothetical protein